MDELQKINSALEKVLPRKFTKESLLKIIGKVKYELDIEAINKAVNEPLWDLFDRGGKRWRPILFLTIIDLLAKNPDDFIDLAVVFEIIHNGTLVVDDFEDSSLKRRGGETLHLKYGSDIAINAGNLIYFLPLKILDQYKERLSQEVILKIYQVYLSEMVNLGLGQSMDIAWHRGLVDGFSVTEGEYLQMCAFKTGGLARMACKIAAIAGGADEKLVLALGQLGESLGVVFQIQDDILNITENELSKMKGLGEDITEGKISLPVINTLNTLPKEKGERLSKILLMHTQDKELISEAINLIEEAGGVEKAKVTMKELFDEAIKELEPLLTGLENKDKLLKLAHFLVERDV